MDKNSRILIAGSESLAGRALFLCLREKGYAPSAAETEKLLDFCSASQLFQKEKPEYVFLVAGTSGGIAANQKSPASLMRNNLLSGLQVMEAARVQTVKKLLFLGSSCVYPVYAPQPMKPEDLMTSPLETTCQSYALAKLSGLELCRAYRQEYSFPCIAAIASDPFGPEDSFDTEKTHVVSALIARVHHAKKQNSPSLTLWGSGNPIRDFIFSHDLAEGCLFLMTRYDGTEPINLTANQPLSIRGLAQMICDIVGYRGEICFDQISPDGAPSKVLDAQKIMELGWKPGTLFRDALARTYEAYLRREAGDTIHA